MLELLHEASLSFGRLKDMAAIGEEILEHLESTLHYQRGLIALYDGHTGTLRPIAHAHMGLGGLEYAREMDRVQGLLDLPQGIARWVAEHGKPIRTGDVRGDPRYLDASAATRSELAVPLLVGGQVIGAVNVESDHADAFDEHDQRVLETVAGVAAVALDNARLALELHASKARLGQVSRRFIALYEEKTRWLGRELHDQLGQMLSAVKLHLDLAERSPGAAGKRLKTAQALIDELLGRVGELSLDLRPPLLDELGLSEALSRHIEQFRANSGLSVELRTDGLSARRLHQEIEITVFRMVQEALTNILRHAKAAHVRVDVRRRRHEIAVQIEDDGRGFDAESALARNRGLGGMRERVQLVGGRFAVASRAGHGARVFATLLVSAAEAGASP